VRIKLKHKARAKLGRYTLLSRACAARALHEAADGGVFGHVRLAMGDGAGLEQAEPDAVGQGRQLPRHAASLRAKTAARS
jgi:hypothetical protein